MSLSECRTSTWRWPTWRWPTWRWPTWRWPSSTGPTWEEPTSVPPTWGAVLADAELKAGAQRRGHVRLRTTGQTMPTGTAGCASLQVASHRKPDGSRARADEEDGR